MGGMSRKNGCTLMVCWISVHCEALAINGVEASIGIPGFIEVNAVHAWIKQLLYRFGVVAKPVIRRVGHYRINRMFIDASSYKWICIDGALNGILFQTSGRDGADDPVTIP